MKNRLIIISGGSFARETYFLAKGIAAKWGENCPWIFTGFLDDRQDILQGTALEDQSILSSVQEYAPLTNDRFVCAIGDPQQRQKYTRLVKDKGGKFTKLLAPSAKISDTPQRRKTQLQTGITIAPFCVISTDVSIGAHTMICDHCSIGHDATIGQLSQIGAFTFVGGNATIGDRVTIHPHATILPNAVIENDATIGAGSVVLRHVAAGETVFGVPARTVRT